MSEGEPPQERLERGIPRWAVIGIFLLLAVAGLAAAEAFLIPVILAFLLALVFTPPRRGLNRLGVPSWLCALMVSGALLLTASIGLLTLSGPIAQWIDQAPQIAYRVERKLRDLRGPVEQFSQAKEQIDQLAQGKTKPDAPEVEVKDSSLTARVASMTPQILAQAVFVLVLLFFLIASGDMFYEKIVHVLPSFTNKRRAMRIALDIEHRLARYLSTITLINALLGVAIGLSMWALGMPNPVLFGVLGFLLNFIPFIGALIGVALATIIGFIALPDPWWALVTGAVYLALTTVEGQLVTPYFVGRMLRLNTVIVFMSVAFFAWLWSVVGMIIAVPLLVVARVFSEHIEALEPLGDFLSARGLETQEIRAVEAPNLASTEPR